MALIGDFFKAMRLAQSKAFPIIPINSSLAQDPGEQVLSYLAIMWIGNVKSELAPYQVLVLPAGIRALESEPIQSANELTTFYGAEGWHYATTAPASSRMPSTIGMA